MGAVFVSAVYTGRHAAVPRLPVPRLIFFMLRFHAGNHHVIAVISIVQRTVDSADRRRRGAGLLRNLQVSPLLSEHTGHLKALRQRKKFIDRANVLEKSKHSSIFSRQRTASKSFSTAGVFIFLFIRLYPFKCILIIH